MLKAITTSVRPILTYLFAIMYITVSTWGVMVGKIEFAMYFAQVGTMVSMMVSFWFGERSVKNSGGQNEASSIT